MRNLHYHRVIWGIIATLLLGIAVAPVAHAGVEDEIAERSRQIQELQQQINKYQTQIDLTRGKSLTLENEIAKLNAKINQINLEIRSLQLSIDKTTLEIGDTEDKIVVASDQIDTHKEALSSFLKLAYENDQRTLTEILLDNDSLSDFFNNLNDLQTTQDNLRITINNIKGLRVGLEVYQEDLEGKKTDLERLRVFEEIERRSVGQNRSAKDRLLTETRGEESRFQELVKKSQTDIGRIREQIFYLRQHGVSAEDAVKFGQLAAIAAGIRPAFLIAILEIESGLGRNVGTGNWQDDMVQCYVRLGTVYYPNRKDYYLRRAETEKNAFLKITSELGLNPDSVKVSKEPTYGCGGAMGPAQFIPSTWLAYKDEVSRITGHNPPSPWNIEDAFTASAIKLSRGGATSQDVYGETRAAKAYISGSPTCSSNICNYYSNAVQNKADSIEQSL